MVEKLIDTKLDLLHADFKSMRTLGWALFVCVVVPLVKIAIWGV